MPHTELEPENLEVKQFKGYETKESGPEPKKNATPYQTVIFDMEVPGRSHFTHYKNINKNNIIKRISQITAPAADMHAVLINLDVPKLLNKLYENIRLTCHSLITPAKKEITVEYYHADGAENNKQRLVEHELLKNSNNAWIAGQQQKSQQGLDGSGDLIRMGDYNISVVIYNKKTQKLEWNPDFFDMLKTAYPCGIYGLSIPAEVLFKIRGLATGVSRINNQAVKNELNVWCAKNIILHLRTDKQGIPIDNISKDLKKLLQQDPDVLLEKLYFTETESFKDHTDAFYSLFGMGFRAGANMGDTGNKELNDVTAKFDKETALDENGGVLPEVNVASQVAFKKAGELLIQHLGLNIQLDANPEIFLSGPQCKLITAAINKLLEDDTKRSDIKQKIRLVVQQWFSSKEYVNYTKFLSNPPALNKYSDDLYSWEYEEVNALVLKVMTGNKDYIAPFIRFLNTEDCGGYIFPRHGKITGEMVDNLQATTTVTNSLNAMEGIRPKSIILGGDPQDTPTQALWYAESESCQLANVYCWSITANKSADFDGSDLDWVKDVTLKQNYNAESDYLIRFNNQFYYINKQIEPELQNEVYVNQITAEITSFSADDFKAAVSPEKKKETQKIYTAFEKKFDAAQKNHEFFQLDLGKDSDALDALNNLGIYIKCSKKNFFHDFLLNAFKSAFDMMNMFKPSKCFATMFAKAVETVKPVANEEVAALSVTLD